LFNGLTLPSPKERVLEINVEVLSFGEDLGEAKRRIF
jgi:hypothetical protein